MFSFLEPFPGLAATSSVKFTALIASAALTGSVLNWSAQGSAGAAQGVLKG